jgi:hypothetical protein
MTSPTPEMKELSTDWIDRFFSLYEEGRKDDVADAGYIDYFKARTFIHQEIDASYKRGVEETLDLVMSRIDSHGFKQWLLGNYELKEKLDQTHREGK